MGRIDHTCTAKHDLDSRPKITPDIIRVKREQRSPTDMIRLPPAVFERTADKAAHVLDLVPLGLGRFLILGKSFPGPGGLRQLFHQFGPEQFPVLPGGSVSAAAFGDRDRAVVFDFWGFFYV